MPPKRPRIRQLALSQACLWPKGHPEQIHNSLISSLIIYLLRKFGPYAPYCIALRKGVLIRLDQWSIYLIRNYHYITHERLMWHFKQDIFTV
ncbi:hypothetical protein K449DRAFT_388753 [Hypoxylon sp. EC38]|nr:hypothetical protein K449DRAFT_388753 [Hypoxylon sp. EC38]